MHSSPDQKGHLPGLGDLSYAVDSSCTRNPNAYWYTRRYCPAHQVGHAKDQFLVQVLTCTVCSALSSECSQESDVRTPKELEMDQQCSLSNIQDRYVDMRDLKSAPCTRWYIRSMSPPPLQEHDPTRCGSSSEYTIKYRHAVIRKVTVSLQYLYRLVDRKGLLGKHPVP